MDQDASLPVTDEKLMGRQGHGSLWSVRAVKQSPAFPEEEVLDRKQESSSPRLGSGFSLQEGVCRPEDPPPPGGVMGAAACASVPWPLSCGRASRAEPFSCQKVKMCSREPLPVVVSMDRSSRRT